jgi:O-antigen/teichoic acid export membrane protein
MGAVQAAAIASGVGLQVLAARSLPPREYACFASVNLVCMVLVLALVGGLPMALRREVSARPASLAGAFRAVLTTQLPLGLAAGGLLAAVRGPLGDLLASPELVPILPIVAAEVAVRAGFLDPCLLLVNAAGDRAMYVRVMAAFYACRVAFAAGLLGFGVGLAGASAALLLAAIVAGLAAGGVLAAGVGVCGRLGQAASGWGIGWSGFGPGYEVVAFALPAVNLWVVGALYPEHPELGAYAVITMMSRLVLPFGQVLGGGSFRWVAWANATGDVRLPAFLCRSAAVIAAVAVGGAAAAAICGPPVIGVVFGPVYANSPAVCGLLFGASGLAAGMGWAGESLGAMDRVGQRFWAAAAALGAGVAVTVLLAHVYGLTGAAAAAVIANGGAALALGRVLWAATRRRRAS